MEQICIAARRCIPERCPVFQGLEKPWLESKKQKYIRVFERGESTLKKSQSKHLDLNKDLIDVNYIRQSGTSDGLSIVTVIRASLRKDLMLKNV